MRVVGIETEYGVIDRNDPGANPILLSSTLVASYRASVGSATAHWDYGGEDPLNDLRGHRRERDSAHSDLDEPEVAVSRRRRRGQWEDPAHLNAVLPNGARLYVDHAHPEYSCPEVTSAMDAVVWDKAGDEVMREAAVAAAAEGFRIALFKNNVDGKGASYGTHENFLVERSVPFEELARRLTTHLVTRQVYTGAGRVGLGQRGETPGFQISQRADYIEEEVGLETTLRRPIVNTRDEPHADRNRWRRLHIIIGDANCLEVPTFLKIGTTSLVLSAIEAGDDRLDALRLAMPVESVQKVSRDLGLSAPLALAAGGEATALDLQDRLTAIVADHAKDDEDRRVLELWGEVLGGLRRDPLSTGRMIEWVAKYNLLTRLRERLDGAPEGWEDPSLAAADIRWSDLDPSEGLYNRLVSAGAFDRIAAEVDVASAVVHPPQDTRATLRGRMVRLRSDIVDAAGWSTIVLDRETEHGDLEVIHLDDPLSTSHPLLDGLLAT
jgi:proteasome accessory factor A